MSSENGSSINNKLKRYKPVPFHPEESEEGGEGNWLVSYADMMTLLVGFFVILLSFSKVDDETFDKFKQVVAKEFGGNYQVPYGDLSERIKAVLEKQGVANEFSIKQSPLGVEISFLGAVFFDTGSAEIKLKARNLLDTLFPVIKEEAKDFEIIIEGHTDDVSIIKNMHYNDNWELSGARASKVISAFEKFGFSKKILTSVGYADARPILPNRNDRGEAIPVNQSQNRRVVIKLIHLNEPVLEKRNDQTEVKSETNR